MSDEKKTEKKQDQKRGVWVVVDDAGVVQAVEGGELNARRLAEPLKARTVFWGFGARREDVIKAGA